MLVDDKSLSKEGLGGRQCYLVLQEAAHFSGNGWLPTSNIQTCGSWVNFTALGGGWALQRASTKAVSLSKMLWGSTHCRQGLGTEAGLSGTGEPQTGPTAQAWSHQCPREGRGIHTGSFKAETSHRGGSSTRIPGFGWMRNKKEKAFSGKWKLEGADMAPSGSWWA